MVFEHIDRAPHTCHNADALRLVQSHTAHATRRRVRCMVHFAGNACSCLTGPNFAHAAIASSSPHLRVDPILDNFGQSHA